MSEPEFTRDELQAVVDAGGLMAPLAAEWLALLDRAEAAEQDARINAEKYRIACIDMNHARRDADKAESALAAERAGLCCVYHRTFGNPRYECGGDVAVPEWDEHAKDREVQP